MEEDGYDILFKIILVGDTSVGKTNIISKYLKNLFQEDFSATIGVEFSHKQFLIDNHKIKAQIWDTAGQERYRSITSAYYKGAKGCLIVYDITRKATFESVDRWLADVKGSSDNKLSIILLGNKCDNESERKVSKEEGEEKAKYHNVAFLETSALNGTNIEKAFQELINDVYHNNKGDFKKDVNLLLDDKGMDISEPKKEEKGCCG